MGSERTVLSSVQQRILWKHSQSTLLQHTYTNHLLKFEQKLILYLLGTLLVVVPSTISVVRSVVGFVLKVVDAVVVVVTLVVVGAYLLTFVGVVVSSVVVWEVFGSAGEICVVVRFVVRGGEVVCSSVVVRFIVRGGEVLCSCLY